MASDKAERSQARDHLDYCLGLKRISLSRLRPEEFDELLATTLRNIDLRELRGFKPLKELVSRHPGSYTTGRRQDPMEYVNVTEESHIVSPDHGFTWKTHAVSAARGLLSRSVVYRQKETGEETAQWDIANTWGSDVFIRQAEDAILVLRRPNDHTGADQNLFEVRYTYFKVPRKDEMVIESVNIRAVSLESFRAYFGEDYPEVAESFIWELESLASATLRELTSQAERFRQFSEKMERLSGSVAR